MPNQVLQGLRILVVEDVDAIRSLVVRLVESLGAEEVFAAMGVETALSELEACQFDAVLLDYELGGRDGLEILNALRQDPSHINHSVPVILLTGHAESHVVKDSVMAGANGYLVKPVMPEVLGKRIQQVVAAHEEKMEKGPQTEVVWRRST